MEPASDEARVEMYALLPDVGESDIVHAHIPAGAEILELGCGAGRMTRRLLELGHPVTALDISQVMLERVPAEATKVHADIDTEFDLGRRFPVVLMASHLVDGAAARLARLETCRRHVSADGQVIVERWPPGFDGWENDAWHAYGPVEVRVPSVERRGNEFRTTMEFRVGDQRWFQPLTVTPLEDAALRQTATEAGLVWGRTLSPDGSWVELRPAPPEPSSGRLVSVVPT